jgi:membrane fusion protein, heavy metal efflux system
MKKIPSRRPPRVSGWRLSIPGALGALALAASGCGAPGAAPARATEQQQTGKPGLFKVSASQLSHLRIARVQTSSRAVEVHTTGTADWDADRTTQAITQVNGPIARIVVDLGTRVKAGDPLLYVASPDLSNAISTYRKAKNRLDLAQRTLARNRDLLEHRAIAQKDLEGSEADYNDAFTEVQNDLQALKIFGVTDRDIAEAERQNIAIRPELAVRSPIAGVVVQKLVLPGQFVQAGTTICFVISEPSTLWVQAHLNENEITAVHVGDRADVRAASLPGIFPGRITYIGAMLDPATRTTPVRVVTENHAGLLKKDQFVDVLVHSGTRGDVLVVPTSAVLYNSENFPFVYVQVEPGSFAQRLVTIGAQQDDGFEVLSGLAAGDAVVAEGSVFLQFAQTYER